MAQTVQPSPSLWFRWKSLKLPWRRKWLIGQDLSGTTFWELHNPEAPWRPRRMALPAHGRQSLAQASELQLSPAWLQWLRHTRPVAPTLQEQQLDQLRQMRLKELAAAADVRWREKPRISDSPAATAQVAQVDHSADTLLPDADAPAARPMHDNEDERASLAGAMNVVGDQVDQAPQSHEPSGAAEDTSTTAKHPPPATPPQQTTQSPYKTDAENPWARHRANPGDRWQPAAWKPGPIKRR